MPAPLAACSSTPSVTSAAIELRQRFHLRIGRVRGDFELACGQLEQRGDRSVGRGRSLPDQSTRASVASSCAGLKGLTIQPVAPAFLPSIFFSMLDSVVSSSTGVSR